MHGRTCMYFRSAWDLASREGRAPNMLEEWGSTFGGDFKGKGGIVAEYIALTQNLPRWRKKIWVPGDGQDQPGY